MSDDNEQQNGSETHAGNTAVTVGVILVIGLIAAVGVPSFTKARNTSQQNACVGNLRIIDSGKEQAAMAYILTDGNSLASSSANEYVKGNTTPICPAGGTYTYGKVGQRPVCTVVSPTSHLLP